MRLSNLILIALLCFPVTSLADAYKTELKRVQRLEDCVELQKRFPDKLGPYQCFFLQARKQKRYADARSMLEELLKKQPDNHRARLFLGHLLFDTNDEQALATLERALEGLQAAGDLQGEMPARRLLSFYFSRRGDLKTAEQHLVRAVEVARKLEDEKMLVRIQTDLAMNAYYRRDYTRAWTILKELESSMEETDSEVLSSLSAVTSAMGRYREAFDYRQRQIELLRRDGDTSGEAEALAHLAALATQVKTPRPYTTDEQFQFAQQALEAAIREQDGMLIANAHGLLADSSVLPVAKRLAHREKALAKFREIGFTGGILKTLIGLAAVRFEEGIEPWEEAQALLTEAIELSGRVGRKEYVAMAWRLRAMIRWLQGPAEQAMADSWAAVEATEAIFDSLQSPQVLAQALGRFSDDYRLLAGAVLHRSEQPTPDDLAFSLRIMERIRARILLSQIARSDRPAQAEEDVAITGLRKQVSGLQKQLLDPRTKADDRQGLLDELDRLEHRILAAEQAAGRGLSSGLLSGAIPGLAQVQQSLAPDQAILAYQLAQTTRLSQEQAPQKVRAGGSWVLVITRDSTRACPLEERSELEGEIQVFLGLVERRDESEKEAARILHRALLSRALEGLSPDIERFVIVPDGPLHRLPFGALRADDGRPLAQTRQITLAPSVSVWSWWRRARPAAHRLPVVSLADPRIPAATGTGEHRAAGVFRDVIKLGRLPRAGEEGQRLAECLGGGTEWLLLDDRASEQGLKQAPLADFSLIHLAAHAVIDEANPQRSAVVLAAGADGEDGLLQVPEIAELGLTGQAVILSTCNSAKGKLLEGEGNLSLSRAFIQAGARAVLGSLWRVRDEEGLAFVSRLGQELADGKSMEQAYHATQCAWIQEGKPAAAWAGFVLLGDGDLVPFPATASLPLLPTALVAGLVLILLLGLIATRKRRKTSG